jgi:hypothetical protein
MGWAPARKRGMSSPWRPRKDPSCSAKASRRDLRPIRDGRFNRRNKPTPRPELLSCLSLATKGDHHKLLRHALSPHCSVQSTQPRHYPPRFSGSRRLAGVSAAGNFWPTSPSQSHPSVGVILTFIRDCHVGRVVDLMAELLKRPTSAVSRHI